MRYLNPNDCHWENPSENEGLLFFVQRLDEMINYYTENIYKVPVQNTYYLVDEYITTESQDLPVDAKRAHLSHILEEFQESFKTDILIEKYLPEMKTQVLQKLFETSPAERIDVMKYIKYLLRDYHKWASLYLKQVVTNGREKKKIEKALRCFLPCVIHRGYSAEFIYSYSRTVFRKQPVLSIDSLNLFLNRFDYKKRKYTVYVGIQNEVLRHKEIIEKRLEATWEEGYSDKRWPISVKKYEAFSIVVEELDEYSAAQEAFLTFNLFFRYYNFLSDRDDQWLHKLGKVVSEDNQVYYLPIVVEGMHFYSIRNLPAVGSFSEAVITNLLNFAHSSFPTIDKAVSLHDIALTDKDLKNCFLNLWSIIEILFVHSQSDSKIVEIEKQILPILLLDYIHSQFLDVYISLRENLSEESFVEIKRLVTQEGEGDSRKWIFNLIIQSEYDSIRKQLYVLLSDYPLLRSRIAQLNELFSSKKEVLHTAERQKQRISWHLRRLYRARNAIIHSGDTPLNLWQLCSHLHGYVDCCLNHLINSLSFNQYLHTIQNVTVHANFQVDSLFKLLDKKESMTKEDIDVLCSLVGG